MGFLSSLLPSAPNFYGLFEEIGGVLRLTADQVVAFAAQPPGSARDSIADDIKTLEQQNDKLTHKLMSELHASFITPFDREDIHSMVTALDDILDLSTYAVRRATVYRLGEIPTTLRRQFTLLADSIRSVCDTVDRLRTLKTPADIAPHLEAVHRLEHEADQALTEALAELFADSMEPKEILKRKDIHELVESAINACERVADLAEGVAIKQV